MDRLTCDVLVVGGGGAGLRAAIAVAETHPKLRVAVISKVYPMRSHTVSAEGGAAAVIKRGDSLDEHAYDTISGGDWLCDQAAVEAFVKEAPEEMLRLEHWGCPWSREPDGHIAVRPFGGMKTERTSSAPGAAARSFPSRPTPTSRTATAWRSRIARGRPSRTWSSSSTTPQGSRSRAS